MRRVMGACVAGLVVLAGVLVASPARADVTGVSLIAANPVDINDYGVLIASLTGDPACAQPVTYDWDFDNDQAFDDLTGSTDNTASWQASKWSEGPGGYTVGVRATVCGTPFTATTTVTVPGAVDSFSVTLPASLPATVGEPAYLVPAVYLQPNGSTLQLTWDLDGDGVFGDSTSPTATFTPTVPGTYIVQLRARHSLMTSSDPSVAAATSITATAPVPTQVELTPAVVTGTARVGYVLFSSGATPTPANATPARKWLRDGVPITGATLATYRLTTADAGRRVGVQVGATLAGYAPATPVKSNTVAVAAHNSVRPTFSGTLRVGRKLTGTRGTWYAPNHTYTYRWLRDGKAISGATGLTYVTKSTDRGRRISLRVTRQRAGFPTVHAFSVARTIAR